MIWGCLGSMAQFCLHIARAHLPHSPHPIHHEFAPVVSCPFSRYGEPQIYKLRLYSRTIFFDTLTNNKSLDPAVNRVDYTLP